MVDQRCATCHTSHQMSDMLENKNLQGKVAFFCSHRCLMMDQAQSFSVSGTIIRLSCFHFALSSIALICSVQDLLALIEEKLTFERSFQTEPREQAVVLFILLSRSMLLFSTKENYHSTNNYVPSLFSRKEELFS